MNKSFMTKYRLDTEAICSEILIIGSLILFIRTILMIKNGALHILIPWVAFTIPLEMLLDGITAISCSIWMYYVLKKSCSTLKIRSISLHFAAYCTSLHALRVSIFVLGRYPLVKDFDVRREYRSDHGRRWRWWQVYLAALLSLIGLMIMTVVWYYLRKCKGKKEEKEK